MSKVNVTNSAPMDARSSNGQSLGPTKISTVVLVILSIAWLAVPAVQYLGTLQRTEAKFGREPAYPQLVELDLLPVYVILLIVTLLYAALTSPRRRAAG